MCLRCLLLQHDDSTNEEYSCKRGWKKLCKKICKLDHYCFSQMLIAPSFSTIISKPLVFTQILIQTSPPQAITDISPMVPKFVDLNMTFVPSLMSITISCDSSSIVPFTKLSIYNCTQLQRSYAHYLANIMSLLCQITYLAPSMNAFIIVMFFDLVMVATPMKSRNGGQALDSRGHLFKMKGNLSIVPLYHHSTSQIF